MTKRKKQTDILKEKNRQTYLEKKQTEKLRA